MTKEAAIEDEEQDGTQVRIYTDGSAIEGKVGAAAVIYKKNKAVKKL